MATAVTRHEVVAEVLAELDREFPADQFDPEDVAPPAGFDLLGRARSVVYLVTVLFYVWWLLR